MVIPTIILGLIAAGMLFAGYNSGQSQHIQGLKLAFEMTYSILPLLLFVLIIAGMFQVLLPKDIIARWIGGESGIRGILIGSVAGALVPGGPMVTLPIVAGLVKSGAGIATLVSFITSWSLLSLSRVVVEVGILGWQLTLMRVACTFFLPPLAGLLALYIFAGR